MVAEVTDGTVELSMFGRNLPDTDRFSATDAFLVVYWKQEGGELMPVGRTETVWDEPNPDFVKKVRLSASVVRNADVEIVAKLYDNDAMFRRNARDDDMSDLYLKKQNFLGQVSFDLCKLVRQYPNFERLSLDGSDGGHIVVHARVVPTKTEPTRHVYVQLNASQALRGKKKLFAIVYRKLKTSMTGPQWTPVWRSEEITNIKEETEFGSLFAAVDDELRAELFEYRRNGGHEKLVGSNVPITDESSSDLSFGSNISVSTGRLFLDHHGAYTVTLRFQL